MIDVSLVNIADFGKDEPDRHALVKGSFVNFASYDATKDDDPDEEGQRVCKFNTVNMFIHNFGFTYDFFNAEISERPYEKVMCFYFCDLPTDKGIKISGVMNDGVEYTLSMLAIYKAASKLLKECYDLCSDEQKMLIDRLFATYKEYGINTLLSEQYREPIHIWDVDVLSRDCLTAIILKPGIIVTFDLKSCLSDFTKYKKWFNAFMDDGLILCSGIMFTDMDEVKAYIQANSDCPEKCRVYTSDEDLSEIRISVLREYVSFLERIVQTVAGLDDNVSASAGILQ